MMTRQQLFTNVDLLEEIACLVEINDDASCSGLILDEFYVLTHASILIPVLLKEKALIETVHDNSLFQKALRNIVVKLPVKVSLQRNCSKVCLTGQFVHVWNATKFTKTHTVLFPQQEKWKFTDDSDTKQKEVSNDTDGFTSMMLVNLMPYFLLIKLQKSVIKHQKNILTCDNIKKGQSVCVVSTPFGNVCPVVFFNSLSSGVISQYINDCVILTDAKVVPKAEGAPLCVQNKNGDWHVAGIIVSSLFWKNAEWLGLSIACSMSDILSSLHYTEFEKNLLSITGNLRNPLTLSHSNAELSLYDHNVSYVASTIDNTQLLNPNGKLSLKSQLKLVVMVKGFGCWGSGVIIDPSHGYILTCSHVIKDCQNLSIRLWNNKWIKTDIIYRSSSNDPVYDIALLKLCEADFLLNDGIPQMSVAQPVKGSVADVIGHAPFGNQHNLSGAICHGIVSQVVYCHKEPILIQTSCTVQSGVSGGAVFDSQGRLLGIVTSNAKDSSTGATYPHINLVVPAVTVWTVLENYMQCQDSAVLESLETTNKFIRKVWSLKAKVEDQNLQEMKSKL